MKKLLCFDLDGTIVDSSSALVLTFSEVFRKNNLAPISSAELKQEFGDKTEKIIRKFYPNLSARKMEQCLSDFDEIIKKHSDKIKEKEGAQSLLKRLKKKGYSLAVVSNENHDTIINILENSGLGFEHFDAILGADNLSKDEEVLKAEHLTKSKATAIIGDTIYDIRAGKKAGVKTIIVSSGINSMKKIWKENPSIIINRISEVDSVL